MLISARWKKESKERRNGDRRKDTVQMPRAGTGNCCPRGLSVPWGPSRPSPVVLRSSGPQAGNELEQTHVTDTSPFPVSFPRPLISASWNQLLNGVTAPKSSSRVLRSRAPKCRQTLGQIQAKTHVEVSTTALLVVTWVGANTGAQQ